MRLDLDRIAAEIVELRLKQFNSKLRRQILMKAGNAAAKPVVAALKAAEIPKVSGSLRKAIAKKVKGYAASNTVVAIAGPKNKRTEVNSYDYYRKERRAKGRKAIGPRVSRSRPLNPAFYTHLAGPMRKSKFVQMVRVKTRRASLDAIARVIAEEVAKV